MLWIIRSCFYAKRRTEALKDRLLCLDVSLSVDLLHFLIVHNEYLLKPNSVTQERIEGKDYR